MATTGGKTYPKRPTLAEGNALSTGFDGVALDGVQVANRRAGAFVQVGGTIAADWPIAAVRFFAVDYDNGNDQNLGFSDVSLTAAGAVAIKTAEELATRLPKNGMGRTVVVAFRARAGGATYRNPGNTADGMLDLRGIGGYSQITVRGTDTIATAGCVAFDNTLADKIGCGARIVTGTNAPGYKATGAPTVSVVQCLTAGGAAPAFAAEPALNGKRIRFDAATPTVALRNICSMIYQVAGGDTLTFDTDLPAVPAMGGSPDIFYIEQPGVALGTGTIEPVSLNGNGPPLAPTYRAGTSIAGFGFTGTTTALFHSGYFGLCRYSFIEVQGTIGSGFAAFELDDFGDVRIERTYDDETGTSIKTGVGVRSVAFIFANKGLAFLCTSSVSADTGFGNAVVGTADIGLGAGCYFVCGVSVQGAALPGRAMGVALIGNNSSTTIRRFRVTSAAAAGQTGAIFASGIDTYIRGVNLSTLGAKPGIIANGVGRTLRIDDAIGATGNTDVGVDIIGLREGMLALGTIVANTLTGNAGDIRLAGPAITTHAGLTTTNVIDVNGNNVQGSAGHVVDSCVLVSNQSGGALGIGDQVKSNGTTGQVTSALADTTPESASLLGTMVTPPASTAAGYMTGGPTPVADFDGAPTVGAIAYLSPGTAKKLTTTVPAVAGTNQKLRVGRVITTGPSGNLAKVTYYPEQLAVVADGAP